MGRTAAFASDCRSSHGVQIAVGQAETNFGNWPLVVARTTKDARLSTFHARKLTRREQLGKLLP